MDVLTMAPVALSLGKFFVSLWIGGAAFFIWRAVR